MRLLRASLVVASGLAAWPSFAQVTAEQLANTEIRTEQVGDGLHVLFGVGGNIGASIGEQGVLIVDTEFPELVPKYRAALAKLGGDDIDIAIDTHWHYDHSDGNQRLGPEGVWIIAQENSRAMMMRDKMINTISRPAFAQPAYAADALPVATFDDHMSLHFNGERVDIMHFGPAHTTGDAAVFFREHNAVHTGDAYISAGYPFIDADNGGDLDGMIHFLQSVLENIEPGAIVIPGHGPVSDYAALARYIEMLRDVRGKIAALIDSGANLEQILAAKPTADWDSDYGNPAAFINRAYTSLTR